MRHPIPIREGASAATTTDQYAFHSGTTIPMSAR
jgi:hypothetical protein